MSHRTGGRIFNVKSLARVEGEGALFVQVEGDQVTSAQLNIYEPPRFFEAFLRGRTYLEPPDITARICGICPVAYQMSACRAIEDACGVTIPADIDRLRRLLYCGEWIESHTLHIYMLHAPDFLGVASAIDFARDHRPIVERGLRMKKIGNRILEVVGGRAIHPINVRVGGFHRAPTVAELHALIPDLEWARQAAIDTVRLVSGFSFPDYRGDWDFIALAGDDEYPIMGNRIVSASGNLDIPVQQFSDHLRERQVPYSTALHGHWELGKYLYGPLARYNINYELLPEIARATAEDCGFPRSCRNPFQSIVVRALEVLFAFDEALHLVANYSRLGQPFVEVPARAGVGYGIAEAPRGLLYHSYELDEDGTILAANIVPPTAQNQEAIEHDLCHVVEDNLHLDDAALTQLCETAIRNYDPCISCSAHFLDLHLERS